MTWCIHNSCKIRDKAQRPSAFKSQPSGRLTCSTPELGWIRCTISTSPRNQKRKIPHLEGMSCYLIMCKWLRSGCLLKQQEGCCRSLRLCIGCPMKMVRPGKAASCSTHRHRQMRKGKGWGQAQRPAVQHNDIDGWDKEKRPAVHFT